MARYGRSPGAMGGRNYGMSPGRSQAQYGHTGHAGKSPAQAHRDQTERRDVPQQAQHITGGAAPVAPLTGHPVPTEQEISQANLKAFVRDQEEKRLEERGNQYDPTFRQKIRMGINRLGQGVSRGIGSLAMMMNPFALGAGLVGNRQAGMLMNLLTRGKRRQANQYFDPDEARDIERELSMMAPYSTNYLKNLDLSKYDTPTNIQDIDFGIGDFDLGTFDFDKDRTIEQDQDLATQRFVEGPKSQLEVWQDMFGESGEMKTAGAPSLSDWIDFTGGQAGFPHPGEAELREFRKDRWDVNSPFFKWYSGQNPLAKGGRVNFSEGGIVGLWRELSSL